MSKIIGRPLYAPAPAGGGKPSAPKFTYDGDYVIRDDGVVELLTSGTITFLTPAVIDIFCVGGGGGGAENHATAQMGFGAGGGGYTITKKATTVSGSYTISIGNGGAVANRGGTSSFGTLATAEGGYPGSIRNGGSGGSGGGGGTANTSNYGSGGSDGTNGEDGTAPAANGGAGQGSTTREFNEPSGKLYAGGGGGGRYMAGSQVQSPGGSGGGGYGAWRGRYSADARPASAGGTNTGGGGGGGAVYARTGDNYAPPAAGGSGIVCFREAQELPELAGTWVLNKILYPSQAGGPINEDINYTAVTPNNPFNGVKITVGATATTTASFYFNQSTTFTVYQFSKNQWVDSTRAISQITFPAGATASDNFRAWLASNATKQTA